MCRPGVGQHLNSVNYDRRFNYFFVVFTSKCQGSFPFNRARVIKGEELIDGRDILVGIFHCWLRCGYFFQKKQKLKKKNTFCYKPVIISSYVFLQAPWHDSALIKKLMELIRMEVMFRLPAPGAGSMGYSRSRQVSPTAQPGQVDTAKCSAAATPNCT